MTTTRADRREATTAKKPRRGDTIVVVVLVVVCVWKVKSCQGTREKSEWSGGAETDQPSQPNCALLISACVDRDNRATPTHQAASCRLLQGQGRAVQHCPRNAKDRPDRTAACLAATERVRQGKHSIAFARSEQGGQENLGNVLSRKAHASRRIAVPQGRNSVYAIEANVGECNAPHRNAPHRDAPHPLRRARARRLSDQIHV